MKIRLLLSTLIATILLSSCAATKNIKYFQDLEQGVSEQILNPMQIKVKPEDQISIIVNSKDPQLASLFNLPLVANRVGQSMSSSSDRPVSGYTIDSSGSIDFPVLGKIHIAGMNREEIGQTIKEQLISKSLVKDPIVTVEFMNLVVAVMGEVNKPGRFNIDRDKITLLDAISQAGDLTIYGKRENILVLRQENEKQVSYKVNLCSGYDLYASPVFYLQQNDVVYVEPNSVRARQSTVNGNNVRSASFWMSLTSLLTTIAFFIIK